MLLYWITCAQHSLQKCRSYAVKYICVWITITWSCCCAHIAFVVLISNIKVLLVVLMCFVSWVKAYRSSWTTSSNHITHIMNSRVEIIQQMLTKCWNSHPSSQCENISYLSSGRIFKSHEYNDQRKNMLHSLKGNIELFNPQPIYWFLGDKYAPTFYCSILPGKCSHVLGKLFLE